MNHFGTYLRTHVQVIFQGRHPTLKLLLKKSPKLYKSMFQKKFYLAKIQKKTKIRPKKPVFFYQKLQFIVFFFKIFKSTLLKISLLFPNSSHRGPKNFFSSKNRSKTLLTPFSRPTSFSGADKLQIAGWGNNRGVREARGIFALPPEGFSGGGNINLGWGNRHFNSL